MKQALKALIYEMEYVLSCINADKVPFDGDDFHEALRLGKEALAQPEQEPFGYLLDGVFYEVMQFHFQGGAWEGQIPVYTTPPQRTWVGLTEEEIEACFHYVDEAGIGLFDFAEAIEAKLKEKNA